NVIIQMIQHIGAYDRVERLVFERKRTQRALNNLSGTARPSQLASHRFEIDACPLPLRLPFLQAADQSTSATSGIEYSERRSAYVCALRFTRRCRRRTAT